MIFYLVVYGPLLLAFLLASAIVLLRWRQITALPQRPRVITSITVGAIIAAREFFRLPFPPEWTIGSYIDDPTTFTAMQYLVPLALTAFAIALLAAAGPRPLATKAGSSAPLRPRTISTFVGRGALWFFASTVALVIVISVIGATGSSPDDLGRYTMYENNFTSNTSVGTTTYGWWFFERSAVALAIVCTLLVVALLWIARPPLSEDSVADMAIRAQRSKNICAVATGGVLLHLGAVFSTLRGAAGVELGINTSEAGLLTIGTPFAALVPLMLVATLACMIAGTTLWWKVVLSASLRSAHRAGQLVPA